MAQFREYLKQEGIETEFEEIHLPIQVQEDFLKSRLQVLRLPEGERFEDKEGVVLAVDNSIKVTLDLLPRLELARSGASEAEAMEKMGGEDRALLLRQYAPLFDWHRIYFDLLSFKRLKGFYNLSFGEASLREILQKGSYAVLCPDGQLPPRRCQEARRAEDIAIAVLKKYVAAFYDRKRRAWEQEHMRLVPLSRDDPNLTFGDSERPHYTVRVKRDFANHVLELVKKADDLRKLDETQYPHIHFDRHLYQPLLATGSKVWQERMESTPPALNEGEAKFVRDLRSYLQTQKAEFEGKQVFLLRNLTRGRGIGFFEAGYPDFILWVIQDKQQWISFVDPHGLRYAEGGFNDPKVQLHTYLKDLEPTLQKQCAQWQVHLASFIVARGSFEETRSFFGTRQHSREEFEKHNILFSEDSQHIGNLLQKVLEDGGAQA